MRFVASTGEPKDFLEREYWQPKEQLGLEWAAFELKLDLVRLVKEPPWWLLAQRQQKVLLPWWMRREMLGLRFRLPRLGLGHRRDRALRRRWPLRRKDVLG